MANQKTNIERLIDALRQVDDGEYVRSADELVVVDGMWEQEPLEGALATHLVPLSSVITEADPQAMFLREGWADGTTPSGREFEISAAGTTLILSIGSFTDDERKVYKIRLQDLAPAWLRAVGA